MDDAERRAREMTNSADAPFSDLKHLASRPSDTDRVALAGEMPTAVGRCALGGRWRRADRPESALDVLRDHRLIGYASRPLGHIRSADAGVAAFSSNLSRREQRKA
jgi:hypothetical protein